MNWFYSPWRSPPRNEYFLGCEAQCSVKKWQKNTSNLYETSEFRRAEVNRVFFKPDKYCETNKCSAEVSTKKFGWNFCGQIKADFSYPPVGLQPVTCPFLLLLTKVASHFRFTSAVCRFLFYFYTSTNIFLPHFQRADLRVCVLWNLTYLHSQQTKSMRNTSN